MARNGSGTYNLPAGNPVVTGTAISSTWANNTLGDMATALTGSIASDGQTTPSANLPMGNFAHTGVANATNRTMYAAAGQVQDNVFQYLTSVSGADTITAVASYGMTGYVTGQRFTFISAGTNTGAVTLNINGIGAKAVTKNGTTALTAGDIASGVAVTVTYDGTRFQIASVAPAATVSSFSAGTTGLTPSTATTGDVVLAGTLNVANGGTGSTSLTQNAVLTGNGTSAPASVRPSTNNYVLTSTKGSTITAGSFVVGTEYTIVSVGTTNFTSIGAANNNVGTVFTATGVGSGTGTASINTWTSAPNSIQSATSQATTSGTTVDFTGIPSWVKRITVMLSGVSASGSGDIIVQLGTSGGFVTTGYNGQVCTAGGTTTNYSTGFMVANTSAGANTYRGIMTIANLSGNLWVESHIVANANRWGSGDISLSGALTQLRLSTTGGDTFDAGSINIIYE